MSNYEIYDLILTQRSGRIQEFGLLLSLVSAYLIAAYIAGKKLERSQVLMISVMFTIAALILVAAMNDRGMEIALLITHIDSSSEYMPTPLPPVTDYVMNAILFGGIGAALLFMWNVRRRNSG